MKLRRTLARHLGLERIPIFRPNLQSILEKADPHAPLSERIQWLEELISWIRLPFAVTETGRGKREKIQDTRVTFLLLRLEELPSPIRSAVAETFQSLLLETEPVGLFSQVGLGREASLLTEMTDRVLRKVLPAPRLDSELSELFTRIFRNEDDAEWIRKLEADTMQRLQQVLFLTLADRERARERFRTSILGSLIILTAQISAAGLSPEIRERSEVRDPSKSWFFLLAREIAALCDHRVLSGGHEEMERFRAILRGCRSEVRSALNHLNEYGVSVAIVYRLELLEQALDRCEKLIELLFLEGHSRWQALLADLIRGIFASRNLGKLIQRNLHLLSRKIVERVGVSGERYIVRNKQEYVSMLLSAMGGGTLTVGTTLGKFAVSAIKPAPFFEGALLWLNYSGSFLLMQAFHFTLATKQPSMTASALAGKLSQLTRRSQVSQFVSELVQINRSQFAAAAGNLGMVIPGAFLLDRVYLSLMGHHVLGAEYGQAILKSLDPFTSLTILYAALTGVLLWLSSLAAGWCENWVVYRRIPEALSSLLKGKRAWVAPWLVKNVAGIAGNASLGFFLAFTPVMGRFFGLPLDVRHVTLSAGALTFAVCGIGLENVGVVGLASALLGIALIGLLNFGVSFLLALGIALRARDTESTWLRHILAGLLRRFRYRPLEFFLFSSRSGDRSACTGRASE